MAHEYTGSRSSPLWTDLWTAATAVDFQTARAKSQTELINMLASDDALPLDIVEI